MTILFTKFPLESHFGGGEKHTLQLAAELQKAGHRALLFSSDPILLERWEKAGWGYYRIPVGLEPTSAKGLLIFTLRLPFTFLQFGYWTWVLKKKEKIDAVYAQSLPEKMLMTPWLLLARIPTYWMEHLQIENWLRLNPYRSLYHFFSRYVQVITVSYGVAQQLTEIGIPQENIRVVYNGIDTEYFAPKKKKEEDVITLGTAARIAAEKNIASVIEALALVKKKHPNFRYLIAGSGDQLESLKKLTEQLGLAKEVTFTGFNESIRDFLEQLDIFVLTSYRRESFGIAVAEAMAMAKPAIVSDIPGLQEVVKHNVSGLIVPPNDVQALAEAISTLIEDKALREKMGKASRERIIRHFSQERMIESFIKLFTYPSRKKR